MHNWLNLKDSGLHFLHTDLMACQFNFREDQLVKPKLIVWRVEKDNASFSLAIFHYTPVLCALTLQAPDRLHGSEHPSMSE